MPEDKIHVGDVFRVGEALLMVTQPRVPCYKLGIKMGDPISPKDFSRAALSDFTSVSSKKARLGPETALNLSRRIPKK